MEDMLNREETLTAVTDNTHGLEAEVDELLNMFNTNQITQEEVYCECELVREELYDARFVGTRPCF